MKIELPKLPKPYDIRMDLKPNSVMTEIRLYSEEQMRAYVEQAVLAEHEACIAICLAVGDEVAAECADAIAARSNGGDK